MANDEAASSLLEAARAFRPRILAEREHIEAGRRLPVDLTRELAGAGLFRISLPAAYGGLDLTPMEAMEVYEELARADASVAWCVWNGNVNWTTAQLSKEVAQAVFANPGMILANSTRPSGQAAVVEGGYRVSGRWSLVSGCQLSSWFVLLSVVHENGAPRRTPSGAPESRFMLCPAADCEIVDTWTTGGLRGTGSHDVVVRDLFVPERQASYFTDPFVLPGARYRIPSTSRVIPGLAAMALGVARSAIEVLIDLAVDKRNERTSQPLRDDRGAQTRLSQAEALVGSARLFLFDSINRLWNDVLAGREAPMPARAQVRLASWHAVTSATQAVDLIYLTGGATSLYVTSPLERAFRDVHAMTQHIAVHPRILETTGRVLFGLEPEIPLMV
jgi:alkylation response protein AidB-like acyl-CoA dehydrogenase